MEDMTSKEVFIFLFKSYLKQAKDDVEKWTKHLERLEGDQAALSSPSSTGLDGVLKILNNLIKEYETEPRWTSEEATHFDSKKRGIEDAIDRINRMVKETD